MGWMPNGLDQYLDEETVDLADSMMDYWFNFASNHNPNEGVSVDVRWPGVNESDNIFILDETISTASISTDRVDICALFDSVGYVPPFSYPDVDETTTTDPDAAEEGDDDALSGGTIAFIVIATVVALVIIVFLIYMGCEQKKSLKGNGSVGRQGSHMAVSSNLSTDSAGYSTADKKL